MDNLALSVSKSITDFLEQNEKRFANHHNQQDQHAKLLEDLQSRIVNLEKRCEELGVENVNLKNELENAKKLQADTVEKVITTKAEMVKMQDGVEDCRSWLDLITSIASQVDELNTSRDEILQKMENIQKNQIELNDQNRKLKRHLQSVADMTKLQQQQQYQQAQHHHHVQHQQLHNHHHQSSPFSRLPARSPSTSSFFNGNIPCHSPMPRYSQQNPMFHPRDQFESLENDDDGLSVSGEHLEREAQALRELHRSFEKSSICSE